MHLGDNVPVAVTNVIWRWRKETKIVRGLILFYPPKGTEFCACVVHFLPLKGFRAWYQCVTLPLIPKNCCTVHSCELSPIFLLMQMNSKQKGSPALRPKCQGFCKLIETCELRTESLAWAESQRQALWWKVLYNMLTQKGTETTNISRGREENRRVRGPLGISRWLSVTSSVVSFPTSVQLEVSDYKTETKACGESCPQEHSWGLPGHCLQRKWNNFISVSAPPYPHHSMLSKKTSLSMGTSWSSG